MTATTAATRPAPLERFCRLCAALGVVVLLACALVTVVDIVGRRAVGWSLPGLIDLSQLLVMTSVFLCIPYTFARRANVEVDLIQSRLPAALRTALAVAWALASAAFLAAATWQAGVAASQVLAPYAPALARAVLVAGMGLHLVFWAVVIPVMRRQPGQGRVTPVWQLNFVGPIVAAQAAAGFGWISLAQALWWPMAATAGFIWIVSLRQLLTERVPAPLRPLLMIHVALIAMLGNTAAAVGWAQIAQGFAWALIPALALAALRARWLTEAGFSALWGAFTFPLAASAGLWLAVSGLHAEWSWPARLLLVLASLVVVPILFMVWRAWAQGRLAVKTNAAIA